MCFTHACFVLLLSKHLSSWLQLIAHDDALTQQCTGSLETGVCAVCVEVHSAR